MPLFPLKRLNCFVYFPFHQLDNGVKRVVFEGGIQIKIQRHRIFIIIEKDFFGCAYVAVQFVSNAFSGCCLKREIGDCAYFFYMFIHQFAEILKMRLPVFFLRNVVMRNVPFCFKYRKRDVHPTRIGLISGNLSKIRVLKSKRAGPIFKGFVSEIFGKFYLRISPRFGLRYRRTTTK